MCPLLSVIQVDQLNSFSYSSSVELVAKKPSTVQQNDCPSLTKRQLEKTLKITYPKMCVWVGANLVPKDSFLGPSSACQLRKSLRTAKRYKVTDILRNDTVYEKAIVHVPSCLKNMSV